MRTLRVIYTNMAAGESKSVDFPLSEDVAYELTHYVHPDGFWDFIWDEVAVPLSEIEADLDQVELDDAFLL